MLEQGYKRSSHFWHDSPLPARTNGIKHLTPERETNCWEQSDFGVSLPVPHGKMVRPPCSPPLTVPYLSWDVHGSCSFYWPWSDTQDQRISFGWKIISSSESFPGNTVRGVLLDTRTPLGKTNEWNWGTWSSLLGGIEGYQSVRALPLKNRFLEVKTSVF